MHRAYREKLGNNMARAQFIVLQHKMGCVPNKIKLYSK